MWVEAAGKASALTLPDAFSYAGPGINLREQLKLGDFAADYGDAHGFAAHARTKPSHALALQRHILSPGA